MTPDEYVRALAQAITRQEDLSVREARDVLYELALRIYWLLLRELPATRMERYMRWPALRREITLLLLRANDQLAPILFSRVTATEVQLITPVRRYFGLPSGLLQPRPVTELLATANVNKTSITALFTPSPRTNIPPITTQLLRLIERSVLPGFMADEPTETIAQRLLSTRTYAGQQIPVVTRGTVANAMREQWKSLIAASLWSLLTPLQLAAAQLANAQPSPPEAEWEWNAILDPRTCPVCRPLDGTTAPAPDDFPNGPPPLHPRCRCIVIYRNSAT